MFFDWLRRQRVKHWNAKQGWRFVGATFEGHCLPEWPVDLWRGQWQRTGSAHLREPLYGQQRLIPIYRTKIDGSAYDFASTEFSNGVFGFYLPR
jgi:hypothetical protein